MDLLAHVQENPRGCDDADCEICYVDVAIEEDTWTKMSKTFWLAGWYAALKHVSLAHDEVYDQALLQPLLDLKLRETP